MSSSCVLLSFVGIYEKVEKMHMGMEEVGLLGRSVGRLCLGLGLVGWVRRSLSLFLDWETCEHASMRASEQHHHRICRASGVTLMLFGMGLSLVWSDLVAYASIATSSRREKRGK